MKGNAYETITARFVEALERGVGPWVRPWKGAASTAGGMPENATTGRSYHGVNVFMLWATAQAEGYSADRWLTFRQALGAGGAVRKGEKGTPVVFWRFLERTETDEATGDETAKRFPMARLYHVFNVEQCDGLPESLAPVVEPIPEGERIDHAEAFFRTIGARVTERGSRACYAPEADAIYIPPAGSFESGALRYATLAHEHVHWTGHRSRLARDLTGRFGSESYGAEELVAELGSAFTCAHLELPLERMRHAEYLGAWVKLLKADPRALFSASSAARKASEYLIERAGESASEPAEDPAVAA